MSEQEKHDRRKKQLELASLFYEMGMPFDVVEKISGIEHQEFIQDIESKKNIHGKIIDNRRDGNYNNERY